VVLLTIFAVPAAYVAWLVALLVKRRGGAVGLSLLVAVATLAAGAWEIQQSRASTAAIGYVFLPTLAAIAGSLALAYPASRNADSRALRLLGVVALVAAALPAVVALAAGRSTVTRNADRDADQARRDDAVLRYQRSLDSLLARVPDRRADTLTALLRAKLGDREFIIAAADEYGVAPALLDSLAQSPDLGVALTAVRNPGTGSATLRRVYHRKQNPSYFFQDLAAHPHTPADILREIHLLRPAPITGLDYWYARNPATPSDVIRDIARTARDPDVMRQLIRHPAVDCHLLAEVAARSAGALRDDEILAMRRSECARGKATRR
jgi:hypothetical protein